MLKLRLFGLSLPFFIFSSCVKQSSSSTDEARLNQTKKIESKDILTNKLPITNPVPLVSIGNGQYTAMWKGHQIYVSGLLARALNNCGEPLSIINGQIVCGNIYSGNSNTTVLENPNIWPNNHFLIVEGTLTPPTTSSFIAALGNYRTARYGAWTTYTAQVQTWQSIYQAAQQAGNTTNLPPQPQLQNILLTNYVDYSLGSPNVLQIRGKLIRITTGSTFAISEIDYIEPADSACPYVDPA
jgi:hypothetical protein